MTTTITKRESDEVARSENTHQNTYVPRFDIWENDDELLLYGDMPGVEPENLDIRFENDQLTLHGKVAPRQKGINFVYGEYGVGDFHRSFTIGESIDSAKISAEMHNGVLTLHLPKTEKVKPRRIEVKAG
jgi:HSP20 family molecular chaperone IbpA